MLLLRFRMPTRGKNLLVFCHCYYSFLIQIEWHPEMITEWCGARFVMMLESMAVGWLEAPRIWIRQKSEPGLGGDDASGGTGEFAWRMRTSTISIVVVHGEEEEIFSASGVGSFKGARESSSYYVTAEKSVLFSLHNRTSFTNTSLRYEEISRRRRKKWIFSKENLFPPHCTPARSTFTFTSSFELALKRMFLFFKRESSSSGFKAKRFWRDGKKTFRFTQGRKTFAFLGETHEDAGVSVQQEFSPSFYLHFPIVFQQ